MGNLIYGAYALFLLGLIGTLTWLACAAISRSDRCWKLSHRAGRIFLRLTGMPFSVRGIENLPAGPCVMVVNHQSYLDGPVIAAALAGPRTFVAKRELLDHWVPRLYLKSIGTVFVDRFDAQRGAEDTGRFTEAARAGASLIVFAEGTFRRMPGLLPFRMGAFMVAAQAGIPVVPATIRGTRSALRADVWLFRHSRISVAFGEPIRPQGSDWGAAVRLRDAARADILRRCAEPDLGEETFLPPKPGAPPREQA